MVIGCILLAGKAVSKLFSRSMNGGLTSESEKAIVRMETKIEYIIKGFDEIKAEVKSR